MEAIWQLYLFVDHVICRIDFRASRRGEFLDMNAKVGGKIMKGMKMVEGRKRVSSSVGQEFVFKRVNVSSVITW